MYFCNRFSEQFPGRSLPPVPTSVPHFRCFFFMGCCVAVETAQFYFSSSLSIGPSGLFQFTSPCKTTDSLERWWRSLDWRSGGRKTQKRNARLCVHPLRGITSWIRPVLLSWGQSRVPWPHDNSSVSSSSPIWIFLAVFLNIFILFLCWFSNSFWSLPILLLHLGSPSHVISPLSPSLLPPPYSSSSWMSRPVPFLVGDGKCYCKIRQ